LLLDEVFLGVGQVLALEADDVSQQLVLETLLGDREVDECTFGLDFGRLVGV